MNKEVRKNHAFRKRTTLFTRILVRLCIPLFFLGAIFAALQLTTQINALNAYYKIQSQFAFTGIRSLLLKEIKSSGLSDVDRINNLVQEAKITYQIDGINIFDVTNGEPLTSNAEGVWDAEDLQAIKFSLQELKKQNPYYVRIDKETNELEAYIPLVISQELPTLVARVNFSLASIHEALATSAWILIIMFFFIILTGVFIGRGLAKSIVSPIQSLNKAASEIMKGKLDRKVYVETGDEIEQLADTFNHMSDNLKEMKGRAEDANPLTQLPGNQGIFRVVNERLHERQKMVLYHVDLDRFKLFNDHFGLGRGDEVIKKTAEILKQAVKESGSSDDFIGHQGGDDFVVVTRPNKAEELGKKICTLFDKQVREAVYRKKDIENGYTVQLDRRREAETGEKVTRKFPLISISVAGITNTKKDISDYFASMAALTAVKKACKDIEESSWMIQEDFPKN